MHKLEQLLRNNQFELVIKLTENTEDFDELIYRIDAFRSLKLPEEVLKVIESHHEVLDDDLLYTLPMHIGTLIDLRRFKEAREAFEYYSNLPYQSQEVEEMLRAYPRYIDREEMRSKSKSSSMSDDELMDMLENEDDYEVMTALDMIRTSRNIDNFLTEFAHLLVSKRRDHIRGMALVILISKNVNRDFEYLDWNGNKIVVNPSKLVDPFLDKMFQQAYMRIQNDNDVTFVQIANQVMIYLVMGACPHPIDDSSEMIYGAIYIVTKETLKQSVEVEQYAKTNHLDPKRLQFLVDKTTSYIN